MKPLFKKYQIEIMIFFMTFLSAFCTVYYFQGGRHLVYADAMSRLNIARKIVDNLTPGIAQIGNVWLPLPQVLMLPFVWNDYLWHSGLAGSIMSMTAFTICGVFIYKSAKLLTSSFMASFFALCVYALNINILYLQTTAMSEAVFLCTVAATMYYFLCWIHTNNRFYLIPAAASVSAMTLTRYEGLAILLSSIPMVFIYIFIKEKKLSKAEASTILYAVVAGLGFALWTLYLTAIFGDPLYWKTYYATPQATGGSASPAFTQAKPFVAAFWQYLTSTVWMVGIIPVIFAIIGTIIMVIKTIKQHSFYFLVLLMPLSVFLFMVMTLMRNTPIVQPDLNLDNILSPTTSEQTGFNIRYGILLLPWFAIMSCYLLDFRSRILKLVLAGFLFAVFAIQIYSYFKAEYTVIYQIPARIYDKPYATLVAWMKQHYDGGLILVSASSHEDQMFEMGFDYKVFIHEGTNKYWKETLDDPPRYASWVIIDRGHQSDMVARKHEIQAALDRDYNLMFDEDQVRIYKIKNKPYIILNN